MPKLGLSTGISRSGIVTPGIITDNLVMKHMYPAGAVQPLSDGAAYLNGDNDHIALSSFTLDTDGNCSVVFWSKRTGVSAEDAVFGNTGTSANKRISFESDGTMTLESSTGGDEATITLKNANSKEWHHYAIVCTSGTVTAFQDGVSCSVANAGMSSDTPLDVIGGAASDGDSKNYQGYLCNIGVWSKALTQAQIKSIMWKRYTDLTSSESTSLTSWWALDVDGSDSTGTNNGTLTD